MTIFVPDLNQDKYLTTEDWGFMLVDEKNAFNEIN